MMKRVLGLALSAVIAGGSFMYVASAEIKMGRAEVFDNLNLKVNVSDTVKALGEWEEKRLSSKKLKTALLEVLDDSTVIKSERLAVLDFMSIKMIDAEAMTQSDLADLLLDRIEDESSPSLLASMMDSLLNLENIEKADLAKKVESLVVKVILDASKSSRDQKYPSAMHMAGMKMISPKMSSSKVVDGLKNLANKSDDLSPGLQESLYGAIGNLSTQKKGKGSLKKSDKSKFGKRLLAIAKESVGDHNRNVADEVNNRVIRALLIALRPLLADPDNSGLLMDGYSALQEYSKSESEVVLKAALRSIYHVKRSEIGKKSNVNLSNFLVAEAVKKGQAGGDKLKQVTLYIDIMAQLSSSLQMSKLKEDQGELVTLYKFLNTVLKKNFPVEMKQSALGGFFNLEPSVFKSKNLSKDARSQIVNFFDYCISSFEQSNDVKKTNKDLYENLSKVLYEMTGVQYGQSSSKWQDWYKRSGRKMISG